MKQAPVILYNGDFYQSNTLFIDVTSDWAKFSLGFFETIKVVNSNFYYFDFHYERMQNAAQYFKLKIPSKQYFLKVLKKLLKKNKLETARLRIQFNVNLSSQTVDYLATLFELESEKYTELKKGWKLGFYTKRNLPQNGFSFKSNDRSIYLLAKKWAATKNLDDVLITNTNGEIVDTSYCGVYWVKKNIVYTSVSNKGGVSSVFKHFLLSQQKAWKFKLVEKKCTPKVLLSADEIFVANVIRGIRWVKKIEEKRYRNTVSKELFSHLKNWEKNL